jgi:hypothetical protein
MKLSDIVITEYNGKVHGSQRDRDPKTGLIDLLVYFEVPEGKREEVKTRFKNNILDLNPENYVHLYFDEFNDQLIVHKVPDLEERENNNI